MREGRVALPDLVRRAMKLLGVAGRWQPVVGLSRVVVCLGEVGLVNGGCDADGASARFHRVDGELGEVILVLPAWGSSCQKRSVRVAPCLNGGSMQGLIDLDVQDLDAGRGLVALDDRNDVLVGLGLGREIRDVVGSAVGDENAPRCSVCLRRVFLEGAVAVDVELLAWREGLGDSVREDGRPRRVDWCALQTAAAHAKPLPLLERAQGRPVGVVCVHAFCDEPHALGLGVTVLVDLIPKPQVALQRELEVEVAIVVGRVVLVDLGRVVLVDLWRLDVRRRLCLLVLWSRGGSLGFLIWMKDLLELCTSDPLRVPCVGKLGGIVGQIPPHRTLVRCGDSCRLVLLS